MLDAQIKLGIETTRNTTKTACYCIGIITA